MRTEKIEYQDGDVILEAYCAYHENLSQQKPTILVVHDWSGRNDFACKKAEEMAELGYIGFAVDMFGKGKIGKTTEEKMALIGPLKQDRDKLLQRILAALTAAKKLNVVDPAKIGVIGFCFGGLCALDLARSGADLRGVVSFHGLLDAPANRTTHSISAKILALHGHDDPMVPPEQVLAFEKEMTKANVDWQLHVYSQTQHAFMNPSAHDSNLGTVYNPLTEKRAWIAMKNFFHEIFDATK